MTDSLYANPTLVFSVPYACLPYCQCKDTSLVGAWMNYLLGRTDRLKYDDDYANKNVFPTGDTLATTHNINPYPQRIPLVAVAFISSDYQMEGSLEHPRILNIHCRQMNHTSN